MYESLRYIHGGKFISRGSWKHPERIIDSNELILVTKGAFSITQGETVYSVSAGDVLFLLSGVRHYGTETTDEEVSFYWIHFTCDCTEELPPVFFRPESPVQAEVLIRQLLHYAGTDGYPRECCEWLLKVLLTELTVEYRKSQSAGHRIYSMVKEWVRINSDMPLKVSDVAAYFNYNEDYLNRIFRQSYPGGLKSYIDRMKLLRIKHDLINEAMSLKEISEKYGFSDYKYFLKYFKYHEGVSPTKYRQTYYNVHLNNS